MAMGRPFASGGAQAWVMRKWRVPCQAGGRRVRGQRLPDQEVANLDSLSTAPDEKLPGDVAAQAAGSGLAERHSVRAHDRTVAGAVSGEAAAEASPAGSAEAVEEVELPSRPVPQFLSEYDASSHRQRLSHPDRAGQERPVPPVVGGAAHPLPGTSHPTHHEHDRSASTQLEHAHKASRKRKLEGTSLAEAEGAPSEHGQASVSCEQVPAPKAKGGADQLASTDTVPSRYPKRERRPNSKYFQALVALVQQLARIREPEQ